MTGIIYLKDINAIPTPPPGEISQNIDLLTELGYFPYDVNDHALYTIGAKKFENGSFVDEQTEEYIQKQLNIKKANIQAQIEILDLKSIRALREGGIKDEESNLSWLDYYKQQIQELRNELKEL